MAMLEIGVLALQGGVQEHINAVRTAADKAKIPISLRTVRTAKELDGLQGILLPGGESTTLSLLLQKKQHARAHEKHSRPVRNMRRTHTHGQGS